MEVVLYKVLLGVGDGNTVISVVAVITVELKTLALEETASELGDTDDCIVTFGDTDDDCIVTFGDTDDDCLVTLGDTDDDCIFELTNVDDN